MNLFIDGESARPEQLAHQALVNYGAYTSFRVEAGGVRGLDRHLARLAASGAALFGEPIPEADVRAQMRSALGGRLDAWLRLSLFSPEISNRDPTFVGRPSLMISVSDPPPPLASALRVRTHRQVRDQPDHKHLGQFGLLHARRLAKAAGSDDALLVDDQGRVSEGTLWNIGFVAGEVVVWPEAPMLAGVTQALLDQTLSSVGLTSRTEPVHVADLTRFDAAFFCNSATPAGSVTAINDQTYPLRPDLIERLTAAWHAAPLQPI